MSSIRERLAEKAAYKKVPLICAFELLPVCNLSCKMCYVRKSMSEVQKAGGLKSADWWLSVAEQAKTEGLLYPLLTGGEPFLHPEFFEILQGLVNMGMQPSVNSNGTLITRETAARLRESPPIRINITLYGASEKAYENLCGDKNAYHRVRESVEILKEYDIPVKFNASITPENIDDLEEMIAYAKSRHAPIQVATYMFPPVRRDASMIGRNARLTPEEAARARVHADYLQNEPTWFLGQAERYSRFVPLESLDWHPDSREPIGMRCRAGLCSFWIDWQGNLMNCGMYPSVKLDVHQNFREQWEKLVDMTAQVRYKPACTNCPNSWLCHTCVAMIFNECGEAGGRPAYLCEMNQASAKYYMEYVRKYYPDGKLIPLPEGETQDICEIE